MYATDCTLIRRIAKVARAYLRASSRSGAAAIRRALAKVLPLCSALKIWALPIAFPPLSISISPRYHGLVVCLISSCSVRSEACLAFVVSFTSGSKAVAFEDRPPAGGFLLWSVGGVLYGQRRGGRAVIGEV